MKQVRDTNGDTTVVQYHTQMHHQGMPGGSLPINPPKNETSMSSHESKKSQFFWFNAEA